MLFRACTLLAPPRSARLAISFWLLAAIGAAAQLAPPPRNPRSRGYARATELPDGQVPPYTANGNFILGPTHAPAPELAAFADLPQGADPRTVLKHGRVIEFTMSSADSKLYPGIARIPNTMGTAGPHDPAKMKVTNSRPAPYQRTVAVYVPYQYLDGTVAPFMVSADGPDWMLFAALDELIAEQQIPVMIGISIGNGGQDAQGSERGLEYDTMSGRYGEFVEAEVLPRVEAEAHVRLTHDPDGRAAAGNSSGGAAAFIMAWYHPDLYRRVLSYSGSFVNQQWPCNPDTPHGAWEFPERLVRDNPRKPIRVWMEVGDRDLSNPNTMRDGMHDWVLSNEKMAHALKAKGYKYQFVFAEDAGHVDHSVRLQTLPEALEFLWRGYRGAGGPVRFSGL